eukprot:TRINITY_DN1823_c0_g1_i1.p1 TRINITY_DN1823_c0_g1~~TRINITY_DN1823_c0_g1_i1.p1  ORF type:complete len:104 (+),score=44.20 TRINITY_DN1823_c0_g1_i1:422-733(+)
MGFSLGLVTGLEDLLSKHSHLFPEALREEIVRANTELNELFNGRSAVLQRMKTDVQDEDDRKWNDEIEKRFQRLREWVKEYSSTVEDEDGRRVSIAISQLLNA